MSKSKQSVVPVRAPARENLAPVTPQKELPVPMCSPDLTDVERLAVQRVLRTSVLSFGPQLEHFENAFADYLGAKFAIAVNSGTSGLHLCVIAAGVKADDLVITTPFSFVASANCILYERGIPIMVDVNPATGNIDSSLAAEAAEDIAAGGKRADRWLPRALRGAAAPRAVHTRLRAVLPVHTFGRPADMGPIADLARRHQLHIIEDACEAIGAEVNGRKVGTLGDAAVFAFYPNKQMTTGEGGMIVTDNPSWNNLFRSLRNQGRDTFDAWLNHKRLGYNYRMNELSAALGHAQLGRIEELLANRERVAAWYEDALQGIELVDRPGVDAAEVRHSWFVYVIRLKAPADRDDVMRKLAEAGVPSRPYFTPIHLQPFYRDSFGYEQGDFPVTEHLANVSLALPFSGVMTEAQVDRVCTALRKALIR